MNLIMTYLAAITLLTITPGVDTMLVIRNSARGGWRDGAVSSFGICTGLFVHAVISAVGISILLLQTAWLFSLLKCCGAAYLIWLGCVNWRSVLCASSIGEIAASPAAAGRFQGVRSFREGFLSNVLNPKTAVFYMAFLPHFIDPRGNALMQSLLLAGLHFLIAMVWQTCLALAVSGARSWWSGSIAGRMVSGLSGSVLVLLGVKLALEEVS